MDNTAAAAAATTKGNRRGCVARHVRVAENDGVVLVLWLALPQDDAPVCLQVDGQPHPAVAEQQGQPRQSAAALFTVTKHAADEESLRCYQPSSRTTKWSTTCKPTHSVTRILTNKHQCAHTPVHLHHTAARLVMLQQHTVLPQQPVRLAAPPAVAAASHQPLPRPLRRSRRSWVGWRQLSKVFQVDVCDAQ